jgi:hypothetical protein
MNNQKLSGKTIVTSIDILLGRQVILISNQALQRAEDEVCDK